ncbi:hypothetical protein [Streptomyces sp. KM273126]|uniref:hypothetical protein n=1 Tax=Streptomyces sp. KM273126 TaxID=2545247 RepID=UPI001C665EA9|nr:hypothetical protein [Streptomyces sp. KM273126]
MRLGIDLGHATCGAVVTGHDGHTVAQAIVGSRLGTAGALGAVLTALGPRAASAESVALVTDFARWPEHPRPVALLRIAPASHPALALFADWPERTRSSVESSTAVVVGGATVTGRPLARLDRSALEAFARRAAAEGQPVFAVWATGAPAHPEPELEAAAVIADAVPGADISLSYEIGPAGNARTPPSSTRPWRAGRRPWSRTRCTHCVRQG